MGNMVADSVFVKIIGDEISTSHSTNTTDAISLQTLLFPIVSSALIIVFVVLYYKRKRRILVS
ncbi:MAG: hypothetical protein KAQ65_08175, partial [Candidatus Thorarchaeota archaeon]|nr:hypothetical protein [Candidatus Thorarchaeota archaeon]